MTDTQQRFNRAGVPTFAFFFLIVMGAFAFLLMKKFKPRNVVNGKLVLFVRVLQACCGFQVLSGLFMIFSTAQNFAVILMIVPLVGIVALHVMDPTFLVLYSALQFYYLSTIASLPDTFQNGQCLGKFGNNDYCKAGWRSFLTFLAVLYQFISLIQALSHFYFFMTYHAGPLDTNDGGLYESLVPKPGTSSHASAPNDGNQTGYQQQDQSYQRGPESYQQATAPQTKSDSNVPF